MPASQTKKHEKNGSSDGDHVLRMAEEDWQHSGDWCDQTTYLLLPPPTDSTTHAALTLQKELRVMLNEQEKAEKSNGLKELGWYIPFELMGDNLFRWMLE